ncbi:MAG: reverse transcriptase domain-containing protein, partial [Verrucomicrobiota bacterium]
MLFAAHLEEGDLAQHLESTPLETIEERRLLDASNTSSLSAVLKTLLSGDQPAQMRTLLALHKRLHHRKGPELRAILSKSGIPARCLSLVEDAIGACVECRRWQVPHSNPSTKVSLSSSFNQLLYGDLMFIAEPPMILLVLLDDCVRFCIVKHVEYKDFNTLTECLRNSWYCMFGPPQRFRCDSESAFASDSFGVYCESINTQRELIIAKDSHSLLSPLDRKIKIIRLAAPRIISALADDGIQISPEDVASEIQYCINSQITYGGITPYCCLFGREPIELWSDESDSLSTDDSRLPWYEMAHMRHRSIAAFHSALLRFRMERSLKARPRTDLAQAYTIGQLVDVYIKTPKKDQEGWRGPGVILGFIGEGRATVRWQSSVKDLPFNLIRPHLTVMNSSALPQLAKAAVETIALPPLEDAADVPAASAILFYELEKLVSARNRFEVYFGTDSADQMRSPELDSLVSLASSLQTGSQQIHAIDTARRHQHVFSLDAQRDQKVIFTLASRFAAVNRVANFSGVLLQSGRRVVTPLPGVAKYHALVWINPNYITIIEMSGHSRLDWIEQGVCEMSELHLLRAIVFLESRKEALPLTQLLERSEPVQEVKEAGRIRGEDWLEDDLRPPPLADSSDDEDDPGPSISEVDSDADNDHEDFLALVRTNRLKERVPPVLRDSAFPVDRKTRPLTPEELKTHATAVEQACLEELQSWLNNQTCVPCLTSDYGAKTGLRPLPARWVIEFKEKIGQIVIKARLCLKGYAESNQAKLSTASPTASRVAHRLIYIWSVQNCWPLESLDVSTAFLQGWTFEELRAAGFERQPVAFRPPSGVWEHLTKL